MSSTPDIAKVVNLIMENPKLIEEISSMVNKSETTPGDSPGSAEKEEAKESSHANDDPDTSVKGNSQSHKNRSQLLAALKPYVSKQRAQAIDSMITIVNILDTMKGS